MALSTTWKKLASLPDLAYIEIMKYNKTNQLFCADISLGIFEYDFLNNKWELFSKYPQEFEHLYPDEAASCPLIDSENDIIYVLYGCFILMYSIKTRLLEKKDLC